MTDAQSPEQPAEESVIRRVSAADNPYYLMATLYGERGERFDKALQTKNRVAWNRWTAALLTEPQRNFLLDKGFSPEELTPFDAAELEALTADYRARCGDDSADPPPARALFKYVRFERSFDASRFIFASAALFQHAIFEADAWFNAAVFLDLAEFKNVSFENQVRFSGASFQAESRFQDGAFKGRTWFSGVNFGAPARFNNVEFVSEARFTTASFARVARFDNVRFGGTAWFGGAHFINSSWFYDAVFHSMAGFDGAIFNGPVLFKDAVFHSWIKLDHAEFTDRLDFQGAAFKTHPPTCYDTRLGQAAFFHSVGEWPAAPKDRQSARKHSDAYECLKLYMDEQKRQEDEMFFFIKELQCKRQFMPWSHRLAIDLFGWASNYGLDYVRPLMGALVFIPLLGLLYMLNSQGIAEGADSIGVVEALGLGYAHTFSVVGATNAYQEELKLMDAGLRLLGTGQSVLGTMCLFLTGLGLRNRFRVA